MQTRQPEYLPFDDFSEVTRIEISPISMRPFMAKEKVQPIQDFEWKNETPWCNLEDYQIVEEIQGPSNAEGDLMQIAGDVAASAAAQYMLALQALQLVVAEEFAPILGEYVDEAWEEAMRDAREAWEAALPQVADVTFRASMALAGVKAVKSYLKVEE